MFRALGSIRIGAQPCSPNADVHFVILSSQFSKLLLSLAILIQTKIVLQDFEATQQSQDGSLINSIIDEVMGPQLRQVIIEAWPDVADVDRSKQVKKVTDITCIQPSPSPLPPLSILHNTSRLFTVPYFFVRSFRYTASYRHSYLVIQMYKEGGRPELQPVYNTRAQACIFMMELNVTGDIRELKQLRRQ